MTTEQKFNCIFCKDVFDNKEELQVHFRKHGDPKFKKNNRFDLESIVSNEKVKEKSDMVSCDVCSQMFTTISKAITHKHKVHPDHDVKYFCPWCGKLFTMKHPYNVHIQSNHESLKQIDNKVFHCDCCDVDFYLPSAMLYHNKFFHRQDADATGIGSSKKLRLYNQEVLQIYYCAFCGEEYENKVNLFKHTSDDHSDENQTPEEVLRCPLCEAVFYHLDAYEIHLSFHSTDDLYSANNETLVDLEDFSLETVPPMIETVDYRDALETEGDADQESASNALEIENFLELAMGTADGDKIPSKVKKKKHKKSKKSAAITLDEFLSMNKDVFGEGLDFQGVEEVPTRVVAKQLKTKKNSNTIASTELEKLKEKGIVVMKVGATKPTKVMHKKIVNKPTLNRELKTSSEVLSKLMNQSNNQIKIVKRPIINQNDTGQIQHFTAEVGIRDEKESQKKLESGNKNDTLESSNNKVETICAKPDDLSTKEENKLPANTEDHSSAVTITNKAIDTPDNKDVNTSQETDTDDETCKETKNTSIDHSENSEQNSKASVSYLSPKLEQGERDRKSVNNLNDKLIHNNDEGHESDLENEDKSIESVTQHVKINDLNRGEIESSSVKDIAQSSINPTVSSLSTLKNLSHLTVKPLNQSKNAPLDATDKGDEAKTESKLNVEKELARPVLSSDNEISNPPKPSVDNDSTLDALKMLSKNITIKSLSTSIKRNIEENESDIETGAETETQKPTNNIKLADVVGNKNITIKKIKIEKDNEKPSVSYKKVNTLNKVVNNPAKIMNKVDTAVEIKTHQSHVDSTQNNTIRNTNTNILKNLPNITSKPLNTMKNIQLRNVKISNAAQKESEIIEISDIDDSDDDTGQKFQTKQDTTKPLDPLKSISKHITVKSLSSPVQPTLKVVKVEKIEDPEHEEDQDQKFDSDEEIPNDMKMCSQKLSRKNMAFKNALKNLGKNITIKSRTSSPSPTVKSQDHNSQDSNVIDENEDETGSDADIGKVKITEIANENIEENFDDIDDDDDPDHSDNNPIVEMPHDSGSDHDETDETDFESEIRANTLQKTSQKITTNRNTYCLNNLKNISKSITIKSLNSNSNDTETFSKPAPSQENIESTRNQNKQLAIKSPQQIKESINENMPNNNKNNKKMCKVVDHTSNESMNQKVSVNKEVTVKTFQTKTVIQEITTTVTKTIKTVNQTVNKQETRNSSQMNVPVLPQKVLGMRPPNASKNLQGVVIRHASPTVKTNNTAPQLRPVGTVVRPSKQIVPIRPGLNITRQSTPRMSNPKTNLPKSSPNKQVIGRPLKFSPSVVTNTIIKRPSTEESNGPFSCFKKPKESLIPVSDVPSFSGSGENTVQVNAASHTSCSNYTSTSKIVKGQRVVTATQMKSEVASMQQFSKVGNTTATKIRNVSQVQEKSESSTMKRTTLDAIEKLQKQGLLVKKPRINVNENSGDSDNIDDNVDYNSADEYDA